MTSILSAGHFDHTILNPAATAAEVKKVCDEAVEYGFFSVCVNPFRVGQVSALLAGTGVKTCSVVGFPLGAGVSSVKAAEAVQAVKDGADELDMVINLGALKEKDYGYAEEDVKAVVRAAGGKTVKVIIETCLLETDEIVDACNIVARAGAHFVKTSTGFAGGGATVEHVALIKKTVGNRLQVKASGGIKTLADAEKMVRAGADRLGASASAAIMRELGG
jgi:deoxyribose-phosphate aldolase